MPSFFASVVLLDSVAKSHGNYVYGNILTTSSDTLKEQ